MFLNETVGFMRMLGIVLLFISMYLLKQQAEHTKMSKQWFVYVSITFLCNGICNVIVSKLYFKDKFSIMQLIGIAIGVFSVLLIK